MKEKFLISLKRAARIGWKNFYRESALSIVAVFVLLITVMLASSLFLVNEVAEAIISDVEEKADVTIDFQIGVPEERILEVRDLIEDDFEVSSTEYISRERAKTEFIERFGDRPEVMESLEEVGNPFPASLNIRAQDPYVYQQIADFMEDEYSDLVYNVDFYHREDVIEGIFGITESIRRGGLITSLVLGAVAILLVYNTIKLAIYGLREEIKVMKLVGSSNLFIQGSFIIQGAIMGAVAGMLSFVLLFLVSTIFPHPFGFTLEVSVYEQFLRMAPFLALVQLGLGVLLGVISSSIATAKYLKDDIAG